MSFFQKKRSRLEALKESQKGKVCVFAGGFQSVGLESFARCVLYPSFSHTGYPLFPVPLVPF